MKKDPHITADNYHISDIMALGRCVWCGRLASARHQQGKQKFCDNEKCLASFLQAVGYKAAEKVR